MQKIRSDFTTYSFFCCYFQIYFEQVRKCITWGVSWRLKKKFHLLFTAVRSPNKLSFFLYIFRKIFIFYISSKYLINQKSASFFRFCALVNLLFFMLLSNHCFTNFVAFNSGRIYVSVETNRTQCFCTAYSKDTICPLVRPRFWRPWLCLLKTSIEPLLLRIISRRQQQSSH